MLPPSPALILTRGERLFDRATPSAFLRAPTEEVYRFVFREYNGSWFRATEMLQQSFIRLGGNAFFDIYGFKADDTLHVLDVKIFVAFPQPRLLDDGLRDGYLVTTRQFG